MDNTKESCRSASSWHNRWEQMKPVIPPLLQSYFIQFFTGINDGNLGIILPSIKDQYNLSQSVVSIVFLCYASGYAVAALSNGFLIKWLTQAKTAMLGSLSLVVGFLLLTFALPFSASCVFYVFVGFGVALTQSGANVFVGELPNATMMLNFLHASYGLGALVGPFIASSMLSRGPWNYTYVVLCSMATVNLITILFTFRNLRIAEERESQDVSEQLSNLEKGLSGNRSSFSLSSPSPSHCSHTGTSIDSSTLVGSHSTIHQQRHQQQQEQKEQQQQQQQQQQSKQSKNCLAESIRYRITYAGAIYLLFYVGIEVSIGDWAYTFLINVRSSNKNAMAHIMSGYWAGLCAGRIALGYVTLRLGEKRMVYIYIGVLISMLTAFWLIPIVAVDATALVISGIALGPLFPTILSVARQCVPCYLYATTVGFLCAMGSGGAALFPYVTGVLIGEVGVKAMPPLATAMACTIFMGWMFIPNPVPREQRLSHRLLKRLEECFVCKKARKTCP